MGDRSGGKMSSGGIRYRCQPHNAQARHLRGRYLAEQQNSETPFIKCRGLKERYRVTEAADINSRSLSGTTPVPVERLSAHLLVTRCPQVQIWELARTGSEFAPLRQDHLSHGMTTSPRELVALAFEMLWLARRAIWVRAKYHPRIQSCRRYAIRLWPFRRAFSKPSAWTEL